MAKIARATLEDRKAGAYARSPALHIARLTSSLARLSSTRLAARATHRPGIALDFARPDCVGDTARLPLHAYGHALCKPTHKPHFRQIQPAPRCPAIGRNGRQTTIDREQQRGHLPGMTPADATIAYVPLQQKPLPPSHTAAARRSRLPRIRRVARLQPTTANPRPPWVGQCHSPVPISIPEPEAPLHGRPSRRLRQ